MHLLKDRGFSLPSSDITAREVYHDRRRLLALLAGAAAGAAAPAAFAQDTRPKLPGVRSTVTGAQTMEKLTSLQDITSYNNFYEFGTDKSDPGRNAHTLKTRPWTVAIEGEVKKPRVVDIDEMHKLLRGLESAEQHVRSGRDHVLEQFERIAERMDRRIHQIEATGN